MHRSVGLTPAGWVNLCVHSLCMNVETLRGDLDEDEQAILDSLLRQAAWMKRFRARCRLIAEYESDTGRCWF